MGSSSCARQRVKLFAHTRAVRDCAKTPATPPTFQLGVFRLFTQSLKEVGVRKTWRAPWRKLPAPLSGFQLRDIEPAGVNASQAGSLCHQCCYLSSFAETTTTRPLSPIVVLPTTTFSPCRKPTGDWKPTFSY